MIKEQVSTGKKFPQGGTVKDVISKLLSHYGTHTAAAYALSYTERQYRNIRKTIEEGKALNPRIELFLRRKSEEIEEDMAKNSERGTYEH